VAELVDEEPAFFTHNPIGETEVRAHDGGNLAAALQQQA
jgi:hypothetical protein